MDTADLKSKLDNIVSILRDGAKGYEHASTNLKDSEIKTLFLRLSQQRKQFIEELKVEAPKLGVTLDDSGTVKGYFHRVWMDVSYVFDTDDHNVIDDSITGEEAAVETYKETMDTKNIPKYLWDTLNNQFGLVQGAMNQLKALKKEVA